MIGDRKYQSYKSENIILNYFSSFFGYFRFLGTLLPVGTMLILAPKEPEEKIEVGFWGSKLDRI